MLTALACLFATSAGATVPATAQATPPPAITSPAPPSVAPPPAPAVAPPAPPGDTLPSPAPEAAAAAESPPPPDVDAGERSDGRVDPLPKRRWRLLPEVLLFPLRALFWGLEWPIRGALRLEDRKHPFRRIVDALTWSGGTRGLRPAFYYSTIYVPEFGVKYFDHSSLGTDTRLDITTTTGGANYVYGDLAVEPTRTTGPVGIVFDMSFDRRGDLLYNGLGNHTYSDAPNGRYLMNALVTNLALRVRPMHGITLFAVATAGLKRFDNGDRVGGVDGIIYSFNTAAIPGFSHGTTFVRGGAGFDIDTRDTPWRPATGVVVRASFDYTHGIDGDVATYERLFGSVALPINLWARTHVLWLSATTAMTWQNDAQVPFSELPTLGGPNDLRGFRFQDFRDYTAFFATAEYRWPIWMWLDGSVFVDYGGVFGQNFADFSATRMQPDVGVGLRLVTSNRFFIRAQLGYGFGEGFNFSISGTAQ